ncbi:hypothetical protein D3C72_1617500 [compost metagenome]
MVNKVSSSTTAAAAGAVAVKSRTATPSIDWVSGRSLKLRSALSKRRASCSGVRGVPLDRVKGVESRAGAASCARAGALSRAEVRQRAAVRRKASAPANRAGSVAGVETRAKKKAGVSTGPFETWSDGAD